MKSRTKTQIKAEHDRWFDAVCEEKIDTLELMASEGFDINTSHRKQGYTGLQFCGRWGIAGSADWLLGLGADLDASSDISMRPLWLALTGNDHPMVMKFLRAGADVQGCNGQGRNVGLVLLHQGMREHHLEAFTEMMRLGLDVDQKDMEGVSPRSKIALEIKAGSGVVNPQAWADSLGAEQARQNANILSAAAPEVSARQTRRTL